MSTATADPTARETLDQFISGLTDDQQQYVLARLLPPFLAAVPGTIGVYDPKTKRYIADIVPTPPTPPRPPFVGMSDEAREAIAKIGVISAEEVHSRLKKRVAEIRAARAETTTTTGAGE